MHTTSIHTHSPLFKNTNQRSPSFNTTHPNNLSIPYAPINRSNVNEVIVNIPTPPPPYYYINTPNSITIQFQYALKNHKLYTPIFKTIIIENKII